MSAAPPARIDEARCVGCSQCRLSCPAQAVQQATAHYEIDPARCTGCGRCVWYCPVGCIGQD